MDGFEDKKWFVYVGDHHEGPFSLKEIQEKMSQGQVTSASFVWAEGMQDWKPMTEVPAFESLLHPPAPAEAAPLDIAPPPFEAAPPAAPEAIVASVSLEAVQSEPQLSPLVEEPAKQEVSEQKVAVEPAVVAPKSRKSSRWISLALLLLLIGGGVFAGVRGYLNPILTAPAVKAATQAVSDFTSPVLIKTVEKFPALGRWISPIPSLDDVLAEDYEDLKMAAMAKLDGEGPRVAVALSRNDLLAPVFYVTTNLPDGAQFDVIVEGVPDTLLNHLGFTSQLQSTTLRRFGKTGVLRFNEGKPLPRGEYNIYVIESESQPEAVKTILAAAQPSGIKLPSNLPKGSRVIAKKVYFLGGTKDVTYMARLKEFHEKLQARSTAELNELKQFAVTLDSQLSSSITTFSRLRKGARVTKQQQNNWATAHSKWMQLDGQLTQSFQKWTPEALKNEYFFGTLYQLVQQTGQAVSQVHGLHHSFFTGNVEKMSFDIQLGQVVSQAQIAVSTLKAKIDAAEKTPPTPNGMPRREEL